MKQNVLSAGAYYGEDGMREFIRYLKKGDEYVTAMVAKKMRNLLPEDSSGICLVPVPSHTGRATRNRDLAIAIASGFDRDKMPMVANVIVGSGTTMPWSLMKKENNLKHQEYRLNGSINEKYMIYLVDDVVATGMTYDACAIALNRECYMLCASIDSETYNQYNKYGTQIR